MGDVINKKRLRLEKQAGSFAAIVANGPAGGRASIAVYDFRALYESWPVSGLPKSQPIPRVIHKHPPH